jgi:hypothetical protein
MNTRAMELDLHLEQPSFDHPHQQQINALVALVSSLLGTLRAKGALSEPEVERALRTADAFLPDGSEALGLRLLAVVREAETLAAGRPEPGASPGADPLDRGGPRG